MRSVAMLCCVLLCCVLLGCVLLGCSAHEGDVLSRLDYDGGDGSGNDGSCPAVGVCPTPPPGDLTICGRVVDLETSESLTGAAERPQVRIFDFFELSTAPFDPNALAIVEPDACGWFHATIDAFLGIAVLNTGNLPPAASDPGFSSVISIVQVSSPGQALRANAFALRRATDAAWAASAGLSSAMVSDRGAMLPIFVDLGEPAVGPFQGAPAAGVAVTINDAPPGEAFYFADRGPLTRSTVDAALTATTANGAVFLFGGGMFPSILSGALPGCRFGQVNGVIIPGVLQVQELSGSCSALRPRALRE